MTDTQKKINKSRSQSYGSRDWQASKLRFTHNEIERKRRARLKSETDFLHRQLPQAIYRDKLAVFKAGTEMLVRYAASGSVESRNLILTDREYSACVLNSFNGFGMRIRCPDGVILMTTDNLQQHLGPYFPPCVGKTLSTLVMPDNLTESLLRQHLTLTAEEQDHLSAGQMVPRNFVLPLITSPDISPMSSCFVEFCGDIFCGPSITARTVDDEAHEESGCEDSILQVLCKVMEKSPLSIQGSAFSLRLQPSTYIILELSGRVLPTGMSPNIMIGRSLLDLVSTLFRPMAEAGLQNAELSGESTFTVDGLWTNGSSLNLPGASDYDVVVKGIRLVDRLHCLVGTFFPKSSTFVYES